MLAAFVAIPAQADNIADCDVVLMEPVEGAEDLGAQIASFRDASDFIASVHDDDRETVTAIDGYAIRGLMCTRGNPLPTQSDFKLIASRVPFILSTDFDSSVAPTVQVMADASGRAVALMAEGLTETQKALLDEVLERFTEQHLVEAKSDNEAEEDDSE